MRSFAVAILLVLCACADHGKGSACVYMGTPHALDDVFPAGDGCNSCTCTTSGPACTDVACVDGGVDANPLSCGASGGCPEGPACGASCCKRAESCVNGTCQCGTKPACGSGDSCETVGPIGGNRCGTLCCGASGPCPQ
jgi:hypothetical protein